MTEWHINADEPVALDYNLEAKNANQQITLYAPDVFRSADHDPLIVGFNPLCGDLDDYGDVDAKDLLRFLAASRPGHTTAGPITTAMALSTRVISLSGHAASCSSKYLRTSPAHQEHQ